MVIDESHNFRNDGEGRYKHLLDAVIKAGAKTKVLMLSATPVNTSLIDLRNQIYLMTEGRGSSFQESLDVGNIRTAMAGAHKEKFDEKIRETEDHDIVTNSYDSLFRNRNHAAHSQNAQVTLNEARGYHEKAHLALDCLQSALSLLKISKKK